jgi:peroxiredoxin
MGLESLATVFAVGTVVLGARVLLAVVFATAGVAKLRDRPGSRNALRGFGIPEFAVPAGAVLLPVAELATAVALVPEASAQWGGLAALILLVGFTAGITNAMARGDAPDCHCFGQLHSEPAGRRTLIRNALLVVPAALVVVEGPGPTVDGWIQARTAAELVAVAVSAIAVLLAAWVLRLRRENERWRRALTEAHAELRLFPPGLPVGSTAPEFVLPSVQNGAVSLEALCARGRPVVLLFASPGCGGCDPLFRQVGRWQKTLADRLTIAIVSTGGRADNLAAARDADDVLLQDDYEVMRTYRVWGTPATMVVTPDGKVASMVASGSIMSESLIRLALRGDSGALTAGAAASPRTGP